MKKISLTGIQPVGNFIFLKEFEERIVEIEKKKSVKGAANAFKVIVGEMGIPECLIEGIKDGKIWNKDEAVLCLIYCHTLLIRANNVAQKVLNKIEMAPIREQLLDHSELKFLWKEYTLTEK